ncbi:MAG: carbohydrate ABC transporter permease [Candidatus Promineifilaceae bacterium]
MRSNQYYQRLALIKKAALYVLLILAAVPFVFPFWWMMTSSLKSPSQIFAYPPRLLPETWHWENFVEVFTYQPFARQYFNSLYIAVLVTIGTLIVASLAGYAFARIPFPGRTFLFILVLSGLMMPSEVTIIPNFFFMKELGLTNSHFPLIVIPIFGAPAVVGTFMMRQFFISIPDEIEDAARIDGASRFSMFWQIAFPIARPVLGGLAILTFLASWNLFLDPFVYLDDIELWTLPLSLRNYVDPYGTPLWHLQMAATTLSVIPVLIIYVIAQEQIIDSFATSGVK